ADIYYLMHRSHYVPEYTKSFLYRRTCPQLPSGLPPDLRFPFPHLEFPPSDPSSRLFALGSDIPLRDQLVLEWASLPGNCPVGLMVPCDPMPEISNYPERILSRSTLLLLLTLSSLFVLLISVWLFFIPVLAVFSLNSVEPSYPQANTFHRDLDAWRARRQCFVEAILDLAYHE